MPIINDDYDQNIKNIAKNFVSAVNIVSKSNEKMSQLFCPSRNWSSKHAHCNICSSLLDNDTCNDRFIVYKFACHLLCNKSHVSETCRPLYQRNPEHKHCLLNPDNKSALSVHMNKDHHNDA